MAKKRKNPIPPEEWAALKARWAETQRMLAEWLERHEAKRDAPPRPQ